MNTIDLTKFNNNIFRREELEINGMKILALTMFNDLKLLLTIPQYELLTDLLFVNRYDEKTYTEMEKKLYHANHLVEELEEEVYQLRYPNIV